MNSTFQEARLQPGQPSLSTTVGTKIPAVVHEVLRSPGQPLDQAARAYMEPRFGHNFGNVRVHNDSKSADSARAVNAQAFTVGQDIIFGAGRFAPTSDQGRTLLAHELAHTVQQTGASDGPSGVHERSAETAGRNIAHGQPAPHNLPVCGVGLSRQPAGGTEEDEIEKRLLAEGDPIMARIHETEGKWKKQTATEATEDAEKAAARERKLFPPVSSATQGLPLLSDEEIPDQKKRRENEANQTKARKEQEIAESHDRLLILGGMIAKGATFNKRKLMALITKDSLLDLQLLTRYGLELPGRSTKQIAFEREVKDAIDRFDAAWRKTHAMGSAPVLGDLTEEKVNALRAEQERVENEAAGAEGLAAVEGSALGGFGAWGAGFFTDDPKMITAVANIGAAAGGVTTAVGSGKASQIEQRAIRESARKQEPRPVATALTAEPKPPQPDPIAAAPETVPPAAANEPPVTPPITANTPPDRPTTQPGATGTRHLPREFKMPTDKSSFPETSVQVGTATQRSQRRVRARGERVGPGEVGTKTTDVPGGRSGTREHWDEHGHEFPEYSNAREYEQGAIDFCRANTTGRFYYRHGGRPTVCYYDSATKTFAATTVDGRTIYTYFRPADVAEYVRALRLRGVPPGVTPRHSTPVRQEE